ncbi:PilN family type IVB pilus formation outer membrane protein [Marinobacterium sp. BA1]|uniref:PilN family type IVB pilus formation outer membrane protein n=1 Tax=Marinobacterium sp. BA1 TaxID=3138931 RepID=UPI0032E61EE6
MSKLHSARLASIAFTLFILSGCKTDMIASTEASIDQHEKEISRLMRDAGSNTGIASSLASVQVNSGSWIPSQMVALDDNNRPGSIAESQEVSITKLFDSFPSATDHITAVSGVPIFIDHSAREVLVPTYEDDSEEIDPEKPTVTRRHAPGLISSPIGKTPYIPIGADDERARTAPEGFTFSVVYHGTLKGLMDQLTARFGVYWDWNSDATQIRVFREDTRTYRVAALMGSSSMKTNVNATSNGGSSESSMEFTESVWESLELSIQSMLSSNGRISVTPATGTLSVTDTPSVLERVDQFMASQNDAMSKQVILNVRVLSVNLSKNDNYGIDWDLAFKNLSETYGISFSSAFNPAETASNLGLRILSDANNPNASINRWTGSSAMFSALSQQGKVSQMTSAAVTTLNNQPVPVRVGRQQAYLASTETTISDNVTTTSLSPGTIDTGFNISLVPHITTDRSLLLQFGMDISSLVSLESFASGESVIQIPQTESRNFLQRVRMNSGETLIVAGFENSNMDTHSQGIGDANRTWAGGGVSGDHERNALVVLIQPIILD